MQKIRQLFRQLYPQLYRQKLLMGIGALMLTGCTQLPIELPANAPTVPAPTVTQVYSDPQPIPTLVAEVFVPEIPLLEQRALVNEVGVNQLISFDGIRPVYQPQFAPASDADMQPDDLVIGIAMDGQAKAYPVGVLRFREMVNDEIAGIPILVSW